MAAAKTRCTLIGQQCSKVLNLKQAAAGAKVKAAVTRPKLCSPFIKALQIRCWFGSCVQCEYTISPPPEKRAAVLETQDNLQLVMLVCMIENQCTGPDMNKRS